MSVATARQETRKPIGHFLRATGRLIPWRNNAGGYYFPINVLDAVVTFDEYWSPYIQAEITAEIPEDQEDLDRADPRRKCVIEIQAGYVYQDGTEERFILLELLLRERHISRPENVMRLKADSREFIYRENVETDPASVPAWGVREALRWLLNRCSFDTGMGFSPFSPIDFEYRPDLVAGLQTEVGTDLYGMAEDLAKAADLWLRPPEYPINGHWILTQRTVRAGQAKEIFTHGVNGTIIGAESALTRDDWANSALVIHEWITGAGDVITRRGHAQVADGPFKPPEGDVGEFDEEAPRKTLIVRTDRPATTAACVAEAWSIVNRSFTRGRVKNIEATSSYWLRPADTVTIKLPTGPQERHLVSAISFRFPSGDMSVLTRQPENVIITTGE